MTPPTMLHFFSRFQSFLSMVFCKIQTFQNPGSDRRTHESALRIAMQLPDKREFGGSNTVTNRAMVGCVANITRQTVPWLSAGTARPTNGNLKFLFTVKKNTPAMRRRVSLSKNFQYTPVSGIIKETGV